MRSVQAIGDVAFSVVHAEPFVAEAFAFKCVSHSACRAQLRQVLALRHYPQQHGEPAQDRGGAQRHRPVRVCATPRCTQHGRPLAVGESAAYRLQFACRRCAAVTTAAGHICRGRCLWPPLRCCPARRCGGACVDGCITRRAVGGAVARGAERVPAGAAGPGLLQRRGRACARPLRRASRPAATRSARCTTRPAATLQPSLLCARMRAPCLAPLSRTHGAAAAALRKHSFAGTSDTTAGSSAPARPLCSRACRPLPRTAGWASTCSTVRRGSAAAALTRGSGQRPVPVRRRQGPVAGRRRGRRGAAPRQQPAARQHGPLRDVCQCAADGQAGAVPGAGAGVRWRRRADGRRALRCGGSCRSTSRRVAAGVTRHGKQTGALRRRRCGGRARCGTGCSSGRRPGSCPCSTAPGSSRPSTCGSELARASRCGGTHPSTQMMAAAACVPQPAWYCTTVGPWCWHCAG